MLQTTCPSAEELRQWTCGDTDESASNTLAEHLQQCEQCQSTLAELDSHHSDSLIQHLKADDPLLAFRDEHDCQQASILAMGAITGQSLEETHTALPVFPKEMNDYRVLGLIAAGGMGKVYRAHHQRLGRDVAIKILSGRRLTDANASVRFEQEIRALGRLSHPNIVSALDARQCDGNPILIMEFVDGLDLSQIVKRLGPLPASSVAAIGRAVAAAIAYASNHGLVHRDIKPSNIMISAAGEVKLLDLGLARIQLDGNVAPEWTGTGLTVGTPDYMSPEQINDLETIDSRSDLYSLGCTLYRLLVGQPPYAGKKYRSNFEKLAAHVSEDPIVIPNANGQYPAALVAIIQRLLAKSPADRPESVQSVALELEKLSSGADLAGLLAMARKLQANETESAASHAPSQHEATSSRGRIPPYIAWAIALGGVPAAFFFGIWLSIKNPDGSETKVQVPNGANASIDDQGNVKIDMANAASKIDNNSPEALKRFFDLNQAQSQKNSELRKNNPNLSEAEIASAISGSVGSKQLLYRGFSREAWIQTLENERSIDLVCLAGKAVIALSETPEERKSCAQLILKKSRQLGAFSVAVEGDSRKWMNMLSENIYQIFPEPFLREAAVEVRQANKNSILTILNICLSANEDQILHPGFHSDGPIELRSTPWRALIAELSVADQRIIVEVPGKEGSNTLLAKTLILSQRAAIPFEDLDQRLQSEAKRLWAAAKANPNYYGRDGYINFPNTPWLSYWMTLPQTANDKAFMTKAVFSNISGARSSSKSIFEHFGKFTPKEQEEICSILADLYAPQNLTGGNESEVWKQMFDCLRRCSNLDKSNIDKAAEGVAKLIIQVRTHGIRGAYSEGAEPDDFRQLLGLPSKATTSTTVAIGKSRGAPMNAGLSDKSVSEAEINGLITASATSSEPLFRGHNFDQWATSLKIERSSDMLKVAVEALVSLAETPEQKSQVMRLILEKSRSLGGIVIGTGNDSERWMRILHDNLLLMLPQPFLDEAIRELPQANENSLSVILSFCSWCLPTPPTKGEPASPPSDKQVELVVGISAALNKLSLSKSVRLERLDYLIGQSLTRAGTSGIPYSKLDPMLQSSSEKAWKNLVQSNFKNLGRFSDAPWLPYWKTLPQADNHRMSLLEIMSEHGTNSYDVGQAHVNHIDKFTAQEQSEYCSLLAKRFQNTPPKGSSHNMWWPSAFDYLRRFSSLEKANIDQAEAIVKSLDQFRNMYGHVKREAVADTSPATFAKLLGVPLPEVKPSPKLEPESNTTAHNEKRPDQAALPNDLENAVKISAASDQRMFRGHSFDEWTKILANEHDGDLVIVAGEAVLTLAQSPEQKSEATKLIFARSRELGGSYYGVDGNDSQKWMMVMLNHSYTLFPEPFLSVAIEELPNASAPLISMMLSVCQSTAGSELLNSKFAHKRDEILSSPKWKLLIDQLSSVDDRIKLEGMYSHNGGNHLLYSTLLLADQLKIAFADLTPKLQAECKKHWETIQKTEISPLYYRDQNRFSNLSAPWLPYWRTLPHEQKNAPFVVRAIFANVAGTRMSAKLFFDNLGKLSNNEQADLCEFLSERFAEYNYASETLPWHWDGMFEYLRTNSSLDKQNVTKAQGLAIDLSEAIYAERNKGGPLATPKRKVDEFRQLLGLPPKTITNATTSSSGSIGAFNSASSTEESIKALMSGNKAANEPLFRGYAFNDWIRALDTDRSEEMQLIAGEAVLTLAENFEQQKQAAKAVLRKSRELGSYTFDQHGDSSQKWMYLLKNNIGRFFPDAFLIAAIEEIPKANAKSLVTILTLCRTSSRVPNSDRPGYRFLDPTTISSPRWNILVEELSKASAQINVPRYFPDDGPSHVVTHTLTLATKLNIPYEKLQPTLQEESKRLWLDVVKGTPEPPSTMSGISKSVNSPNWFAYWKTLPSSEQQKAIVMRSVMNMQNNTQWKRKDILESFAAFTSQEQTEICQLLSDRFKTGGYDPHLWNLTFDCLRRCSNLDKANIDAAEAMVEESKTSERDVNKFRSLLGLPPEPITMPPLIQPLFEKQQSGSSASKSTDSSTAAQPAGASGNSDASSDITLDSVGLGNLESGGAKQAGPKDAEIDAVVQASADDGKPLFRGHPLSAWLKVLERERTYYLLSVACDASITLAENDEELLQVARALLKMNRQIGEFPWEQSALDNWMILLKSKVMFRIFPKQFVVAATDEMDAGNKRSIHTILELATIWPDRSKYFLNGPEAEKHNEELRIQWKTLFDKLSAADKYFDMSKTKDGSTQRDKYFQDMMTLATRLGIEYSALSPLLQAEMKQAWDRDKKKLASEIGLTFRTQHIPTWLPYWKSLPQTENSKALVLGLFFSDYMSELNAKPKDTLDHFEKFTPDEQKEIAKVLVTAYCECKFVTPEQTQVWHDIFACLKRCSSFDPKKLDEAEAKVKDAKQQYLRQSEQGRLLGFPLALKPVHIHELLGSPFGTSSAEDMDLLLPQSKWGNFPAGGGYGSGPAYGSNAYGSNSGITTPSSPYGGYGIGPIISNGQSSTSQAYGGGGSQTQPATSNQNGSR